jgi:hypothetical protein
VVSSGAVCVQRQIHESNLIFKNGEWSIFETAKKNFFGIEWAGGAGTSYEREHKSSKLGEHRVSRL